MVYNYNGVGTITTEFCFIQRFVRCLENVLKMLCKNKHHISLVINDTVQMCRKKYSLHEQII